MGNHARPTRAELERALALADLAGKDLVDEALCTVAHLRLYSRTYLAPRSHVFARWGPSGRIVLPLGNGPGDWSQDVARTLYPQCVVILQTRRRGASHQRLCRGRDVLRVVEHSFLVDVLLLSERAREKLLAAIAKGTRLLR